MHTHTKYTPYPTVKLDKREWADKSFTVAPRWVSTDLRDGNQALANPMGIEQKIAYFKALVEFGFKEIEIAYPSASQTEFDFCRCLIEGGLVPDNVTIGILVPSIERHIVRSFEALRGAKRINMHLYNPTASNQRDVVFRRTKEEIIALALQGVECIKREAGTFEGDVVFEYSPESFSQTELDFARDISNAVIAAWQPTREHRMILNLPNTLEACSPNIYADHIEWMSKHIINRESVIISVHPHNDRGCAVASAELAVLAGAQRVEGTMLGNGERAGNVDIITLAFNYYAQGIDPRDIGREYKDSIRINSQSGKGGVAYILKEVYGIDVPKEMQTVIADEVKRLSESRGGEIGSEEILGIYEGMIRVVKENR
ncbi:hypothetical protein [Sulfuricurvum sp.]|uniref:hypothetical protein n=1 Tax=Sulfuricurvum sp. TaxID=2025608 RepID=UPI00260AC275|nr:hypothetical protein [Sulfuricurvum sp.]MDD4950260.1 hypothetical protein [Sulfuricurvum sp.]